MFNQSRYSSQLFLTDREIVLSLFPVTRHIEVEQRLIGGIRHGNGRFQFMGDVVGEVRLHLIQCLLLQNGMDKIPECQYQNEQNDERGYQYAFHLVQYSPVGIGYKYLIFSACSLIDVDSERVCIGDILPAVSG